MNYIKYVNILALILLSIAVRVEAASNEPSYVFIAGLYEDGNVDVYNMDSDGAISIRSRFDIWNDATYFKDPENFVFSPQGNYLFMLDFSHENGAFYSIDSNLQFKFIKEQPYCGGAGFTKDGEYCFTTTNYQYFHQGPPKLVIYKTNGGAFDAIKSQDAPASATLNGEIFCDSNDLLLASATNGRLNFFPNISIYQFDRSKEQLVFKQLVPTADVGGGLDANADRSVLAYCWPYNRPYETRSVVRQPDGTYVEKLPEGTPDVDWYNCEPYGAKISKDGKYVVTLHRKDNDSERGTGSLGLWALKPDGTMQFLSHTVCYTVGGIDVSPDGRFFIVGYDYGRKIGVFRINREKNILEEIHTMPHSLPGVWLLRFLPQIRPKTPVSEKAWPLYSDTKRSSDKIAQTPPAAEKAR